MRRVFLFVVLFSAALLATNWQPRFAVAQDLIDNPPIVSTTYLPPPPPVQETIVQAPDPQSVWVSGHWDRTPDKWNWVGGTWVKPPYQNAYWLPGYWQHKKGKFAWEPAHWAVANQGVVVAKPIVVPPAYVEVQPATPTTGQPMVWQPGYWEWRGTWVWIPGAYVQSAVPKAAWVPGQWLSNVLGTFSWSPAHWATQP